MNADGHDDEHHISLSSLWRRGMLYYFPLFLLCLRFFPMSDDRSVVGLPFGFFDLILLLLGHGICISACLLLRLRLLFFWLFFGFRISMGIGRFKDHLFSIWSVVWN